MLQQRLDDLWHRLPPGVAGSMQRRAAVGVDGACVGAALQQRRHHSGANRVDSKVRHAVEWRVPALKQRRVDVGAGAQQLSDKIWHCIIMGLVKRVAENVQRRGAPAVRRVDVGAARHQQRRRPIGTAAQQQLHNRCMAVTCSNMQWPAAAKVVKTGVWLWDNSCLHIGAGIQQQPRGLGVAVLRRKVQRGAAQRRRRRVHIGAVLQQQLDGTRVALACGDMQRPQAALSGVCRRVGVDASAEQRFDRGGVAARRRVEQLLRWRLAAGSSNSSHI